MKTQANKTGFYFNICGKLYVHYLKTNRNQLIGSINRWVSLFPIISPNGMLKVNFYKNKDDNIHKSKALKR